jgi:type I restriction enzyme S subunit
MAESQVNISQSSIQNVVFPLPPLAEQKRIVAKIEELLPKVEKYGKAQDELNKLNEELPERLKKSILQEAIEGRLVPQDPNDEPASVLLQKIREEKQQLVKEGKLKKKDLEEKPISDDEIPFEIPDTWEWVRLKDVVYNHGQKTPDKVFSYIDIGSIDNKNQKLNEEENIIEPNKAPSRARKIVLANDIVYSTVRPYLHNMAIINRDFSEEPIASTGFAVLSCLIGLFNKYLFYYLMSPNFDDYANDGDNARGVAYPAINDEKLYKALVPLPPLAEQKRIVAKIEQLLGEIDKLKK